MDHKEKEERGSLQSISTLPKFNYWELARFNYFRNIFDLIKDLEGDVIECGVGWGHSLLSLSSLAYMEKKQRNIWGFDSFEGFPEPSEEDNSPRNPQKGEWKTGLEEVYKLLSESGLDRVFIQNKITLVKGYFEDTLHKYTGDKIALLHADADLYDSYKQIYNDLFDKLVPGGVIMFDEYMNTFEHYKWPGAKKAIDETFLKGAVLHRDEIFGKYYAIKQ